MIFNRAVAVEAEAPYWRGFPSDHRLSFANPQVIGCLLRVSTLDHGRHSPLDRIHYLLTCLRFCLRKLNHSSFSRSDPQPHQKHHTNCVRKLYSKNPLVFSKREKMVLQTRELSKGPRKRKLYLRNLQTDGELTNHRLNSRQPNHRRIAMAGKPIIHYTKSLNCVLIWIWWVLILTYAIGVTYPIPSCRSTKLFLPIQLTMAKESEPSTEIPCFPEDEEEPMVIPNVLTPTDEDLPKRMLAGKILATKPLNKAGVKGALKGLWEDCTEFSVMEGVGNCFAFTFKTEEEAKMILQKSPWFVLNYLMSLQEWGEATTSNQTVMVSTMFGSQMYIVDQWGELTPPTP